MEAKPINLESEGHDSDVSYQKQDFTRDRCINATRKGTSLSTV